MSTYAIGDLQGCLSSLRALTDKLSDATRLIFVGDLVNRGPDSLATLRHVKALVEAGRAATVLGNHDLHLLAVAAGIRPLHDNDTLQPILDAPDCAELLDWLRRCPLAHFEQDTLFVHAGVLPAWTVQQARALSAEVQQCLSAADYTEFLREMYGNKPSRWSDELTGHDRLRCVVNAMTRLRIVEADGRMRLKFKLGPADAPADAVPWFDHPQRATRGTLVVFGHWSTAGLVVKADVIGLDTGCVWGGKLTAMRLADRALVQVSCAPSLPADD